MEELKAGFARLEAVVGVEARNIKERLDRQDRRTDDYHKQNLEAFRNQAGEIRELAEAVAETNGQVRTHKARLEEGDRRFASIEHTLRELSKEPDGERSAVRRRDLIFVAVGIALAGGAKLLDWLLP